MNDLATTDEVLTFWAAVPAHVSRADPSPEMGPWAEAAPAQVSHRHSPHESAHSDDACSAHRSPIVGVAALQRRARFLVGATIAWNVVEVLVSLSAGHAANSSALIGFGLDAAVEVSAAVVALWYLAGTGHRRERVALRLIGASFFALAVYVSVDAVLALRSGAVAETSRVGIALTATSLVVMPVFARLKRVTGRRLRSSTLIAESNQTALCAYLSAIVLGGLVLRATVGWTWSDPLAALGVAALAVREGLNSWRGKACC